MSWSARAPAHPIFGRRMLVGVAPPPPALNLAVEKRRPILQGEDRPKLLANRRGNRWQGDVVAPHGSGGWRRRKQTKGHEKAKRSIPLVFGSATSPRA